MKAKRRKLDLTLTGPLQRYYLVLAAVVASYGVYRLYLTSRLCGFGYRTEAIITYMDHILRSSDEVIEPWHQKVRFCRRAYRTVIFTAGHRRIVHQSRFSRHNYRSKGFVRWKNVAEDRVATVLYDPANPSCWLFDDPTSLWTTPLSLIGIGVGFLFLSGASQAGWLRPPRLRFAFGVRKNESV